jgi:tetratricopeptide (TPR) repeat protein
VTDVEVSQLFALTGAGRHVEAEIKARELLVQHPDSGVAWKVLGVALGVQGKDALSALERAAKLLPDDADSHNNLGHSLRLAGRLDEAVASCRRALQIRSDYPEAHNNLGNALQALGQFEDAVASYRRALQIKPDYVQAHNNLGNALQELDRLEDAVASYRRALQLKPDYAQAYSNLGNALREAGKLDEAVASCRRALEIRPDFAEAHNNLGSALYALGKFADAAASHREALQLKSDYPEAYSNLGNALRDLGQFEDAVDSFDRALQSEPDNPEVYNNLGNTLRDLGRLQDAAACFDRALQIEPESADTQHDLGTLLVDLGRFEAAEARYREALRIKPDFAMAHSNLSIALRLQGRSVEAEASCRRALEIDPNLSEAWVCLGELCADEARFSEAEDLFKRASAIKPNSRAWAGMARLRKMTPGDTAWLAEAQRLIEEGLLPPREANLRYAMGKYFDDVKDFEQAFSNFQRANELKKQHRAPYDRQRRTRIVDRIIQSDDRAWIGQTQIGASASQRPVFIVGMPRSGTTLAEQILASHPAVCGAGEQTFWAMASATHESSVLSDAAGGNIVRELGHEYLRFLEQLNAEALRVVDKMPNNYPYLGWIHAALPNARIIHMRRNPIDTCLSNYFQDFHAVHAYADDLDDLAHHYREYLRLMEHWRSTLPRETMLEVPYEALVADQEAWSRRMVQFIGLPWDPRCLDFHENRRAVYTASRWQVRQKISASSVERWRNYEKFVGPLLKLLELARTYDDAMETALESTQS